MSCADCNCSPDKCQSSVSSFQCPNCTLEECCSSDTSPKQALLSIRYDKNELESIPESSILGVGCGAPLNFASIKEGETVVDLASGAGIDAFLASKSVKDGGRMIGIDFTDDMVTKAKSAAREHGSF